MNVRLLRDECLLRMEKPERLSLSKRLWIPSNAKRQDWELYQATVLDTGPGIRRKRDGHRRPLAVHPGDKVICYWPVGEMNVPTFERDDQTYKIVPESLIQAVIVD